MSTSILSLTITRRRHPKSKKSKFRVRKIQTMLKRVTTRATKVFVSNLS